MSEPAEDKLESAQNRRSPGSSSALRLARRSSDTPPPNLRSVHHWKSDSRVSAELRSMRGLLVGWARLLRASGPPVVCASPRRPLDRHTASARRRPARRGLERPGPGRIARTFHPRATARSQIVRRSGRLSKGLGLRRRHRYRHGGTSLISLAAALTHRFMLDSNRSSRIHPLHPTSDESPPQPRPEAEQATEPSPTSVLAEPARRRWTV